MTNILKGLNKQGLAILDLDGNILKGVGKPSIEVNFHLGIYEEKMLERSYMFTLLLLNEGWKLHSGENNFQRMGSRNSHRQVKRRPDDQRSVV